MSVLQEIQVSGTRRNPFADVALQNLLNSNLSAKYSLTGALSKLILYNLSTHKIIALIHITIVPSKEL